MCKWCHGREVRQRSAKPCTAVQICLAPLSGNGKIRCLIFLLPLNGSVDGLIAKIKEGRKDIDFYMTKETAIFVFNNLDLNNTYKNTYSIMS